jgi:hypothetical protein
MSLGEVLGWKFDYAHGIRTREVNGQMEIFDWPIELGSTPTQSDIDTWIVEYNERPIPPDPQVAFEAAVAAATTIAALRDAILGTNTGIPAQARKN